MKKETGYQVKRVQKKGFNALPTVKKMSGIAGIAAGLAKNNDILSQIPLLDKQGEISNTFRDRAMNIKYANQEQMQLKKAKEDKVMNRLVSFDTILKCAAKYDEDHSIKVLEAMVGKKAGVDNTAKEYWVKYFGAYGKLLTRDYKDIKKGKFASIKEVLWMGKHFARNYGNTCFATFALLDAAKETIKSDSDGEN